MNLCNRNFVTTEKALATNGRKIPKGSIKLSSNRHMRKSTTQETLEKSMKTGRTIIE